MLICGTAAFVLFFLGDINDRWLHTKWLRACFYAGASLLCIAIFTECLNSAPRFSRPTSAIFVALAAIFGALTLWSVLSVAVKTAQADEPRVYSEGVYALCRHPGVLFFIPMCVSLCLGFGFPVLSAAAYIALDVALIVFEDIYIFPKLLAGYADYRSDTPFLLPNRRSAARLIKKNAGKR